MFILRDINASLAQGSPDKIRSASDFPYRFRDVEPRLTLKLAADGLFSGGIIEIPSSGSEVVPLPEDYDSTERLFVWIECNRRLKVETVSPDHPASTTILEAVAGEVKGKHQILSTITSITLTNPSGTDKALVRYFLFQQPDITSIEAFRSRAAAVGAAIPE